MKRYLLAIFFSLTLLGVHAQSSNGLNEVQTGLDTLKLRSTKLDSVQAHLKLKVDSLNMKRKAVNHKVDSVFNLPTKLQNSANNVIDKVDQPEDSIQRLQQKLLSNVQSFETRLTKPTDKIDSLKSALLLKVDKVNNISLPQVGSTKVMDSIKQLTSLDKFQDVQSGVNQAQSKIQDKLDKPAGKINEKMNLLTREAEGKGNLPPGVTAPPLPKVNVMQITNPDIKMPGVPKVENPLGKVSSNVKDNVSIDIKGKINSNDATNKLKDNMNKNVVGSSIDKGKQAVKEIMPTDELNKLSKGTDKLSDANAKVKGYQADVKNIKEGNIDKANTIKQDVLSKAKVPGMDDVQKQLLDAEEQQKKLLAIRNHEEFKKQTVARGREVVMQQLATQYGSVTSTVAKISAHQKKIGSLITKVKDLPSRPIKSKKPPFVERFVPGITLQLQKSNLWLVDLNPSLRFRVRSIWSVGAGWNERLAINQSRKFQSDKRVYGFRSFSELTLKRGLSLRVDVERLNTIIPNSSLQADAGLRKWVWSYMAGFRKDFSFAPGVLGNVQFMYNLYDPKKESPYLTRFNVRFGFELPLKQTKHKHQ